MPTVVRPARRTGPSKAKPKAKPKARPIAKAKPKASPAPRAAPRKRAAPARRGGEQPSSWAELAGKAPAAEARRKERAPGLVDTYSTIRFALLLAIACTALTLYVGHLYSSQTLAEEVQQLRKDKMRLALQHNRLRGEFDHMTAPAVILHRAEAIGLRASGDYGPTIVITD